MASQEEDNKLECISNVNKDQERYFLNVYKKHECILNNKLEPFEMKIQSIIDVWKSIGELNLSQFDIRHVIQIMDWAKLHALNIVLTAEWNGFKENYQPKLLEEIEKAQNELLKLNGAFATRCKKLAAVVKNPWEDPVLMNLMKTKENEIGSEEIEFFCVETAYLVSVRLKKLCESHCEDLALNLVTAFMNCNKLAKIQNFSLNATDTQMWFIFDIYIALLYKFQDRQKIVVLLKELSFDEGLQLVKRFAKKRVKISKIWKNCHRIAVLAVQMFISQAVVKYSEELKDMLENYLDSYISLCSTDSLLQDFPNCIRRISNLADASGLYVFCDVIHKKAGSRLKPFIIEMYIRALTTDMNELERQKDANEIQKVTAITSRLAAAFCSLADILDEHVQVARECVLTAFSLEPTKDRLTNIVALARRSGFEVLDTGQEWKCKLHPPVLPSDEITWICPECGDWMCKPEVNIPLKINMALNEALQNSVLGISESLCDDLVVCLSNPRYQILSWFLPWDDLHRLCIMYLHDPQITKNFVTELKFVEIDYSIFKNIKREPLDELAGIERGYEQYLDHDFESNGDSSSDSADSMSQDSRPYSLGSDGAGEGPYSLFLLPAKSDPNTLKSLRMFRPSQKRSKGKEPGEGGTPEKLLKVNTDTSANHTPTVASNSKDIPINEVTNSLSHFLNGVAPTQLSSSANDLCKTNNHDSHSKNVKTATLPLLGGQVAKEPSKSIQVILQSLDTSQKTENRSLLKKPYVQALKPYNQSKMSSAVEMMKRELMLKLQNKPLLTGSKENSLLKSNNVQNLAHPTQPAKPTIKPLTRIDKETKISQQPLINQAPIILDKHQLSVTLQKENIQTNQHPILKESKPVYFHASISMDNIRLITREQENFQIPSPKLKQPKQDQNQGLANLERCQKPIIPSAMEIQQIPLHNLKSLRYGQSQKSSNSDSSCQVPIITLKNCRDSIPSKLGQFRSEQIQELPCSNKSLLKSPPLTMDQSKQNPAQDSTSFKQQVTTRRQIGPPSKLEKSELNQTQKLSCLTKSLQIKIPIQQICHTSLPLKQELPKPNQIQDLTSSNTSQRLTVPSVSSKLLQSKLTQYQDPANMNRCQSAISSRDNSQIHPQLKLGPTKISPTPDLNSGHPVTISSQNFQMPKAKHQESASLQAASQEKEHIPSSKVEKFKSGQESANSEKLLQLIIPVQKAPPVRVCPNVASEPKLKQEAASLSQYQKAKIPIQEKIQSMPHPKPEQTRVLTNLDHCRAQQTPIVGRHPIQCQSVADQFQNTLPSIDNHIFSHSQNKSYEPDKCRSILYQNTNPPGKKSISSEKVDANQAQNKADQLQKQAINKNRPNASQSSTPAQPQKQPIKVTLSANPSPVSLKQLTPSQKPSASQQVSQKNCSVKETQLQNNSIRGHQQDQLPDNQKMLQAQNSCKPRTDKSTQFPLVEAQEYLMKVKTKKIRCYCKKNQTSKNHTQNQQTSSEDPLQGSPIQSHNLVQLQTQLIKQERSQTSPPFLSCNQLQSSSKPTQAQIPEQLRSISQESCSPNQNRLKNNSNQSLKAGQSQEQPLSQEKMQTTPDFLRQNRSQSSLCNSRKVRSPCPNLDKPLTSKSIQPHNPADSLEEAPPPFHKSDKTHTPQKLSSTGAKSSSNPDSTPIPSKERKKNCPPLSLAKCQARIRSDPEQTNSKVTEMAKPRQIDMEPKMGPCKPQNSASSENKEVCQAKKSSCTILGVINKNEDGSKADSNGCKITNIIKCNNNRGSENEQNITSEYSDKKCAENNIEESDSNDIPRIANGRLEATDSSGISDTGIFSDFPDTVLDEMFFQNNNDYFNIITEDATMGTNDPHEELPKNKNLTENIRTYTKKSVKKANAVNKDCVETLTGDKSNFCINVNSSCSIKKPHSNVQNYPAKRKELKIILRRLPLDTCREVKCTSAKGDHYGFKYKCDRGEGPHKNVRRRKLTDKSENMVGKAPNLVQNHNLTPLLDINPRVSPKANSKSCCDLSKMNNSIDDLKASSHVLPEKNPKSYAKSVLANVPGLNDFQMMRPLNVDQIVNVVQVSGGRSTQQGIPIQNTQTSTQVTPHIQRIGQPRVVDQKPEHSSSVTCATTVTTTATTTTATKTPTTQPSTLINILSQQIIRPVTTTHGNTLRRQTPLINILSQQIIRPSSNSLRTTNNSNVPVSTESNQVKPLTITDQPIINQANNVVKTTIAGTKTTHTATTGQGSTILQFICKSTLPKFQQAFGKSVYQNNTETTDTTSTVESSTAVVDSKKNVTKSVPINVKPIQGSVIYSRQVPVGPTISLIPPGGTTRQVFRIATSNSDQISLVKDSVIHSKMSALLAAALQGRPKNAEGDIQVNCDDTKVTLTRPTLVQSARIVKPVQLQLQPNVARSTPQTNLSSTTLEQLREFDMVYKQVKERSSTTTADTSTNATENNEVIQPRISVTYVNQFQKYTQLSPVVVVTSYSNLQPAASPGLSVTSQGSSSPCVTPASTPTLPKIATKSSKGKALKNAAATNAAKSSLLPKPQQKPQEDEHTTQRIFDILAEYAEQLRNSPDLNNKPAPRRRSNPPTNPSQNSKRKKSSSGVKKSGLSGSSIDMDADDITVGSEDSSGGGVVQLSVTDDEQSQAAIVNTPESNENSSPSSSRQLILTDNTACGNQSRNLIIADSSVGEALKIPNTAVIVPGSYIMPVSMVKGGQQIAVVSGGSKILATVPARSGQNMLLFQSFTNQNRKGGISTVKYSTIQPISGISSQSLAGVSAQPPVVLPSNSVATAVALGQPLTLKKIENREHNELLLTITSPKVEPNDPSDIQPQPDSSTSVSSDSIDIKLEDPNLRSSSSNEKIFQSYQKSVITNSVGTSVIATAAASIKEEDSNNSSQNIIHVNLTPTDNIKVETKPERLQSVLVTACSSNGPMLSHTTPRYRKPSDSGRNNKNDLPNKEFLHNGEKTSNTDQKTFRSSAAYYTNKTKKVSADNQKIESDRQKQAVIERELRLQKSLSEECEDLGVDEPSTSDLFPEADLLFDSNHSPSFDQTSQDIIKRTPQATEIKEEVKSTMNLFSDDENSSSLQADLFEYVEYQTVETALNCQARQLMNGNSTSTESGGSSGFEDNTLLPKSSTMSDVTLNSPISPEIYPENTLHKYKFKYSNRKKGERMKQSYYVGEVVSSSEDTVGSTELVKTICEDDNYKVVHINKLDSAKDDTKCELHCDEDLDSPSGRGARRSVRKLCSCCNGSRDGIISRKRPHSSRPHTPAVPHRKAFLSKKR